LFDDINLLLWDWPRLCQNGTNGPYPRFAQMTPASEAADRRRPVIDLYKVIRDFYAEKEKLERVIASLEDLQRTADGGIPPMPNIEGRRGRKSMGAAERQEVSARMKRYWASRGKARFREAASSPT
jgi:hypothetical protein